MHPTISYICVYNDEQQLNSLLLKSLININGGGVKLPDTLLVDNTSKQYHSCSEAYNKEICNHAQQLGDILIFVHQDISFDDDRFQQRIVKELSANPNQILGAAGMPVAGRTVSNLKYRRTGKYITATQLDEKTEVESVDECCFAMTKDLCLRQMFDEQTCSHWHLYAVDFCYEARRRFGVKSFVLPESIYHKMDGTSGLSTDYHFLWTIWKMTKKYRHDFKVIYTPCYIIDTHLSRTILKLLKSVGKRLIGR